MNVRFGVNWRAGAAGRAETIGEQDHNFSVHSLLFFVWVNILS